MIPVLLKPLIWGYRNRLRIGRSGQGPLLRELSLLTFSLLMTAMIYHGTETFLVEIKQKTGSLPSNPALLFDGVLLVIGLLLLCSNTLSALGSYYLGKDLDSLLASPLGSWSLISGKLLEIVLRSTWIALIFLLPILTAIGQMYGAPLFFYPTILTTIPIFLFLLASAGAIVATGIALASPLFRPRVLLPAFLPLGVAIIIFKGYRPEVEIDDLEKILRASAAIGSMSSIWLPSHWVGAALGKIITHQPAETFAPYLFLLLSITLSLLSTAYLVIGRLHHRAFTRIREFTPREHYQKAKGRAFPLRRMPLLDPRFRAIMEKEFRLLLRDMTQAIQLILLLCLCMIYLYNFRVLSATEALPLDVRPWWKALLILANLAMGSFVTAAVANRFVFPSLSLEGQSYWILKSAPMSARELLRAKFFSWLLPLGFISGIILLSGALAIHAEPHIVMTSALSSWIICYGIVGLATGFGAIFANFDWEHISQVATSLGSLLYMAACVALILLDLIPIGLLIFLRTMRNTYNAFSPSEWYFCVISSAALLVWINFTTTEISIRFGERALRGREE